MTFQRVYTPKYSYEERSSCRLLFWLSRTGSAADQLVNYAWLVSFVVLGAAQSNMGKLW